jgi:catechol 2,3-dioxygenase-like lactoylglutathione lyase family enzyme
MRIEHIAFNVEKPDDMAEWYCSHLGMSVVKRAGKAIFIADESGHGILEIYNNPPDAVPDYRAMNPLQLHVAFQSDDLRADRKRLVAAGAVAAGPDLQPDEEFGILFLKDPWGFTIQLVRREKSILP